MTAHQPHGDDELAVYAAEAAVAMAGLDTLPRPVRLLIHEFGVLPVMHALHVYGGSPKRLHDILAAERADKQAERLAS